MAEKIEEDYREAKQLEMLLDIQVHSWKHSKSCVKSISSKESGICSYNFPRKSESQTTLGVVQDVLVLIHKRLPRNG